MLGKDYMLAIILVNCDGVHGGVRWEGGPGIERGRGKVKGYPKAQTQGGGYVLG